MARAARAIEPLLLFAVLGCATPLHAAEPGTWSTKAPLPNAREDVGAVALEGKIYVVGGTAHSDAQIARNEVYDPTSRQLAYACSDATRQHIIWRSHC